MARLQPERRTPVDLAVTATIVVVLLVVGLLIWLDSPVRHTDSTQAAGRVADVTPATSVPNNLTPRWTARSAATNSPAIARSLVVTADHGAVTGRDPHTGHEVWHYRRNAALCAATAVWPSSNNEVIAAYRNDRGCGEVTALDGSSGRRVAGRSSDADDRVQLIPSSGYVLSQGPTRLESWGANLVRGVEYGRVDAPAKPDVQPDRTGCGLRSAAAGGDRVAIVERCAGDPGYRLTVLGALLDKNDKVQQFGSSLITNGASGVPPVVLAMSSSGIAVYDDGSDPPTPPQAPGGATGATIRDFTPDGVATSTSAVDGMGEPSPPGQLPPITTGGVTMYFTGKSTVVLDGRSTRPMYQVPGTIGTGDLMGGQLLLPVAGGISVRDAATGRALRAIKVPRPGRTNEPVSLRVLGDTVVEQWGSTVQALGPA